MRIGVAAVLAGLAGVGVLAVRAQAQNGVHYTVTDLGDLSGGTGVSYALGMNSAGQIVGYSTVAPQQFHAYLYSNSVMTDLGTLPGGDSSKALSINAAGQVVGTSSGVFTDWSGTVNYEHAFILDTSVPGGMAMMQDLTPALEPTVRSAATGINDAGQVSGYTQSTRHFPFIITGGSTQFLDTEVLGGTDFEIGPINNAGQVFVNAFGPTINRSYLYVNGVPQDIGDIGFPANFPFSIGLNEAGSVVGFAALSHSAFLYSGGVVQDIGALLPDSDTEATAINSAGDITGYFWPHPHAGPPRVFVIKGGIAYDMRDLVDSSGTGWYLAFATAINDAGQIAGYGISPQGRNHAFILNPVPDCIPAAIATPPASASTCQGGTTSLSVVGSGTGVLSYIWQWQATGQAVWNDVVEGANLDPASGEVEFTAAGSATSALSLVHSDHTHNNLLRVIVSNACGNVASLEAEIRVNSADFNGDGDFGTDADIEDFFACLGGTCCAACGSNDYNGDGDFGTDDDIEAFFRVLGGGGC